VSVPQVSLRHRTNLNGKRKYFIDYWINGKRVRKNVGSDRSDAIKIKAETQHRLALGEFKLFEDEPVKINIPQLISEFIKTKENIIRPQSIHRYNNYYEKFNQFFSKNFSDAFNDIALITDYYIKESIDYLSTNPIKGNKPWAKKTIRGYINALRMLFKYAVDQNYLIMNPASKIQKPQIIIKINAEYYTEDQLNEIYSTVEPFWADYLRFLQYTGLRKSEFINLKWRDVNIQDSSSEILIKSDETWATKTGKDRLVPLPNHAIEILESQKNKMVNKIYVFPCKNGKKQHPDYIYRALNKAAKKLNLPGRIHMFRHTYASNLVMKGASLYDVQKLLGHSDIKSTEKYSHLADDHLQNIVNILD
jgi:integrase